jgi:hypothetical protein
MDWISMLFDAIGGALGAGIGILIGKRFSNKTAKTIAVIVPAVLIFQGANELSKNQAVRDFFSPPSRIEKLDRTASKILKDNPKFKNAISKMTQDQVHAYIPQLARQGMRRLSFQELKTWNELRIKLAKNSHSICSGIWSGAVDIEELIADVERFSDQDLQSWWTINMKAAVSELEQTPYPALPDSALLDGIKLIGSKLQTEEEKRMTDIIAKGGKADSNDGCWIMLKLLEGVELLPQPQQELFLRALASI